MQPKLVRDKIPDIIRAAGKRPITRELSGYELLEAALEKVIEEAREAIEALHAPSFPALVTSLTEELGDLNEAVGLVNRASPVSREELLKARRTKIAEKGGFTKGLFLEAIED